MEDVNTPNIIPITPIVTSELDSFLAGESDYLRAWVEANQFMAAPAEILIVPSSRGDVQRVLIGISDHADFWSFGALPNALPEADYQILYDHPDVNWDLVSLAWGLGQYHYTRYKKQTHTHPRLFFPESVDTEKLEALLTVIYHVKDWVNTPTEDFMPSDFASVVQELAKEHKAKVKVIEGEALLKQNFPLVHAVGRAGSDAPRVVHLTWGDPAHPVLALVGKGVCYDTGGLNIKGPGMITMKKDMSGAAHALGVAEYIMMRNLPVQLHLILPMVENALAGNSYRPGDVFAARNGKHVEITNTDAEGRLILADALTYACEHEPVALIDFSTLTGGASMGPEYAALFGRQDGTVAALLSAAEEVCDKLWRLPIEHTYKDQLKSHIADIKNALTERQGGGTITAATFLNEFVAEGTNWVHFDFDGLNRYHRPGRPMGAEVQSLRSVIHWLEQAMPGAL